MRAADRGRARCRRLRCHDPRWGHGAGHGAVRTKRRPGPVARCLRRHVPPMGSRHRTCETVPGPAARCSESQGSRPLITSASAARVRRGVTSPSHGDHGAPHRRATWSRRPRRASSVGHGSHGAGHGGHGAGHGGAGHDPGTRRSRGLAPLRDAFGSRRPRRSRRWSRRRRPPGSGIHHPI